MSGFQLSAFGVVGFSGSRSVVPVVEVRVALSRLAPGACVLVGCASGVDALARSEWAGELRVFEASAGGRGAFAARSADCVRSVAAAGGAWVSFPGVACPVGLLPSSRASRCFCGSGSGSWASLALAVGLGVPCLVWLAEGLVAPLGWGFEPLGRGWFVVRSGGSQLGLL